MMYCLSIPNKLTLYTLSISYQSIINFSIPSMKPDEGAPSAVIRFQSIFYANMKAWRPFCRPVILR